MPQLIIGGTTNVANSDVTFLIIFPDGIGVRTATMLAPDGLVIFFQLQQRWPHHISD